MTTTDLEFSGEHISDVRRVQCFQKVSTNVGFQLMKPIVQKHRDALKHLMTVGQINYVLILNSVSFQN